MINLNENQKKAVDSIDKNLLINAGAGTGKTRVLVERYLNILENGDLEEGREIDSIVAITFTRKAAEEMKERIRESIVNNFQKGPKWRRLYRDMERANISTIHSFCSKILRENPIDVKIDPQFRILEDYEEEKILEKVILDSINTRLKANSLVYDLMLGLEEDSPEGLYEDIRDIYKEIIRSGKELDQLKIEIINILDQLELDEDKLLKIEENVELIREKSGPNTKIQKIYSQEYYRKFLNRDFKDMAELEDLLKEIRKGIGRTKASEKEREEISEIIEEILVLYEKENKKYYEELLSILEEIDLKYREEKEKISALDYDDLQIKALEVLENDEILHDYHKKFRYIMVDEFQDSDELQKKLFYKLGTSKLALDRNNLFFVGDPKQSIYGFRGADLDVFYDVKSDFEKLEEDNIIVLDQNYRTDLRVMDFINSIFSKLMGQRYNPLVANVESGLDMNIELLENQELEIPEGQSEAIYSRHYEADLIAKRIVKLVESGYKYKDIAILFRTGSNNKIYEEALKKYDIPFYNTGGRGFFKKSEIRDLIVAYKAVFNEEDLISNLAFFRSPMLGLSDDTIFYIMEDYRKKGSITRALLEIKGEDLSDFELNRLEKARTIYTNLIKAFKKMGPEEFFRYLDQETNYSSSLLLRSDGKQSLRNIEKFYSYILKYEEENLKESIDIIDYLEEISRREEGEAKVESEASNVVSLMTIHKSKGLEFPVVILAELSFRTRPDYSRIKYRKDLGMGIKLNGSRFYGAIKELQTKEEEEELKRVLYVAMTRAKELLILGYQGKEQGFKKTLSKELDFGKIRIIKDLKVDLEGGESLAKFDQEVLKISEEVELANFYEEDLSPSLDIERTSISQYLDYVSCQRYFYFKHILRLDGSYFEEETSYQESKNRIPGLVKGNIIHYMAENYNGENYEKIIDDIVGNFGYNRRLIESELGVYMENLIKSLSEDWDKSINEEEFSLFIGDLKFRAYIDRINIKGESMTIVDYKTNIVKNRDRLVDYYSPQLRFYGYLVDKVYGPKDLRGEILFLQTGESVEVDLSPASLEGIYEDLSQFAQAIKNQDIKSYKTCDSCSENCQYRNFCS